MKEYIKTAQKALVFGAFTIVSAIFENSVPGHFAGMRISLVLCVCLCIVRPTLASVATGAAVGLFTDFYSCSLPLYSVLYLYISAGCVWSVRLFVSLRARNVFIICFFALLAFCGGEFLLELLIFESFSLNLKGVLLRLVFSIINSALSPIIYGVLKRAKY